MTIDSYVYPYLICSQDINNKFVEALNGFLMGESQLKIGRIWLLDKKITLLPKIEGNMIFF